MNLYSRLLCCLVLAFWGWSLSGCDHVPAGFPKVVPCKIIVVKDDIPLPEVVVMLVSEGDKEWFTSGNSDQAGVAEIQTLLGDYMRKGAPPGTHKVTLKQVPQIQTQYSQVEFFNMSPAEKQAAIQQQDKERAESRSFPTEFEYAATTPISIEVVSPKTEIRLNVSDWIGKK